VTGAGSLILIPNADVVTIGSYANVTLGGSSQITDQNGQDVFRNLAYIGTNASLQLLNGHNLTTSSPLSAIANDGNTLQAQVTISGASVLTVNSSYTLTGAGSVTQLTDPASTLTVTGSNPTAIFGGRLYCAGVINANVSFVANSATQPAFLIPGNLPATGPATPGLMTVNGNLTLGRTALDIIIDGPGQGSQYGSVADNGVTALGGSLQVSVLTAFPIYIGETFTILTDSGPLTGAFTNVANGGTIIDGQRGVLFEVSYGPGSAFSDSVVLTALTPLPEPGSLALLGATAGGWAFWRRRTPLNSQ
jgi:hypothetical protein